jgi:hypothetical protein
MGLKTKPPCQNRSLDRADPLFLFPATNMIIFELRDEVAVQNYLHAYKC